MAADVTTLSRHWPAKTFATLGIDKSEHVWMQIDDVGQLLHLLYPQTKILTGSFNVRALLSDVT